MKLRIASSRDSKTLSALVLEAAGSVKEMDFTDAGWELLEVTNTPSAFEKRFENKNYLCWLCEVEDEVVGHIAILDYEKIDHMFVLPKYRNKGIAKALWAKAKEYCIESGFGQYFCVRSSSYAEPVYESFGFRRVSERKSANGIFYTFMEFCDDEN